MKNQRPLLSILCLVFVIFSANAALAQSADDRNQFASITGMGSSVRWEVAGPHAAVTLTVSSPDGQVFTKEFAAGNSPEFRLADANGERLPDGQYIYELRVTPIITKETKEKLKEARIKGNSEEVARDLRKRGAIPSRPQVQSGGFAVLNGMVVVSGATEGARPRAAVDQPAASTPVTASVVPASSRTGFKIRRHHPAFMVFDQVIPDDLIVQGSICSGFDCVNNENFGTDTIRVKENNVRIQFDDTSVSAGFATNNWQIRANDQASGGSSFLGIVDQGASGTGETGTIVFAVDAGAPANSLRVSSAGIGVGTATPVLDVSANTSDTPAIRLEQNNSGGFTAQTWDIGANEANFFIRDVTGGSRLSLRIRPGAPTSSLDIAANGNVGIATGSPGANLDVSGNTLMLGSDSGANTRTTNTIKLNRLAAPPFTTGNLNFGVLNAATTSTDNIVGIGGGASGFSAATQITFNTGATTNTDTGTERMRIGSDGRVGIGTSAPDQLLSVNGNASKAGGGSWATFSDLRLKNVRGTFNTGLNAVMQLQPLRFHYRPNNAMNIPQMGEQIGFGAQQVQKIIPEAVTANADGYLMVNNDPIIWTMLNAIKEQQQQIQELKQEVRRLRASTRRRARR